MKKTIICLLLLFLPFALSAQKKYYVKVDGNPSLTGTSWGWASNNIQATVDKASSGDTVFVGVGTYYGGFTMKEGVTVKADIRQIRKIRWKGIMFWKRATLRNKRFWTVG